MLVSKPEYDVYGLRIWSTPLRKSVQFVYRHSAPTTGNSTPNYFSAESVLQFSTPTWQSHSIKTVGRLEPPLQQVFLLQCVPQTMGMSTMLVWNHLVCLDFTFVKFHSKCWGITWLFHSNRAKPLQQVIPLQNLCSLIFGGSDHRGWFSEFRLLPRVRFRCKNEGYTGTNCVKSLNMLNSDHYEGIIPNVA